MVFKKSLLSSSIAMTVAAASTATSYAQEPAVEEVVVTGIRGSLMRAMDVKRDAKGVVDAISAEDIGKMPDTNLAESLQRITGVSINRERGEGSRVTVRGFGPDFNLVTLNGRQMPTASGDPNLKSGRSFDFGNIASEGVSGVEVYKTVKARVPTGGIGATINVLTTKPLENPGFKASVGLKGVHDTSNEEGSDLTPELSGIISNTFADDTFGVALTASFQERDSGQKSATVPAGWFPCTTNSDPGDCDAQLLDNGTTINLPQGDEIYAIPHDLGYELGEFHRERVNGQLTMQWEPVESITATVDYTYSELSVENSIQKLGGWFNFGERSAEFDGAPLPSIISYTDSSAADFLSGRNDSSFVNENNSIGFNVEWRPNDNLTLAIDYHDSEAEAGPDSPLGSSANMNIAINAREQNSAYFDNELPILSFVPNQPIVAEGYKPTGSQFSNTIAEMTIEQAQFSGSWEFDEGGSIDFGFATTEVENRFASSIVERGGDANWNQGLGNPGQFSQLFTRASLAGEFDNLSGGDDPRLQTDYYTFDTVELIDAILATQQLDPSDPNYTEPFSVGGVLVAGDCGNAFCASTDWTEDKRTTEESSSWYLQVNMEGMMGEHEARISAGLRYEETDVTSQALVPTYSSIDWTGGNNFDAIVALDENEEAILDFIELQGDYDFLLPSIDFSIDITEDLVFRASYGESIARPNYNDIQAGLTIGTRTRSTGQGGGNQGNPSLKPFQAENYDVSLEWYYGDASYASIGYFRKDTNNFIGTQINEDTTPFTDLYHPALGDRYQNAITSLQEGDPDNGVDPIATPTPAQIFDFIVANHAGEEGVLADEGIIRGIEADGAALFDVTIPVNINDALVDGWEVAVQHNFGETGFGVIANATFVEGDFGYDLFNLGAQFGLSGLSDSANLIAFYDRDGLQARIAYNWRDEFLAGFGEVPTFVEEYEQWDVNVSYEINDYLTVFAEGINVTDEINRTHGRTVNEVQFVGQTGPRYNIGMRASF